MSSTDIAITPAHLVRVRRLYPKAVGIGRATGYRHQVTTELRTMEKAGEVIPVWRFARRDDRTGVVTIPYVRMREWEEVQRARRMRLAAMGAGAVVFLGAVGYAIWSVRELLLAAAGVTLAVSLLFLLGSKLLRSGGGTHCPGPWHR